MTGFKSPDRERFTALFASSISFPDREETHTWSGNNNFSLVNARMGVTYYIMRENLICRYLPAGARAARKRLVLRLLYGLSVCLSVCLCVRTYHVHNILRHTLLCNCSV